LGCANPNGLSLFGVGQDIERAKNLFLSAGLMMDTNGW